MVNLKGRRALDVAKQMESDEQRRRIRRHNRSVRIHDNLAKALDAYVADQRGNPMSANNVTLVVACTTLQCLLRGL